MPPLPVLTNVVATAREDSVGIEFDPVDDAVDYRVYPLPKDGDVTTNADGAVVITVGQEFVSEGSRVKSVLSKARA